jgi:hypothetical protein
MFKRLLLLLLCVFGLSLSVHAETVRISGLFNSPTGTTSYSDGQSYCMSASLGSGRTPTGYIGIGSDKSTIVCSFVYSDGTPSQMGVKHYCLKGGQADTAQFGCYGEKPANSCPAAGTNFVEMMEGETISTGSKGLSCVDGCQVKIPGDVVCAEVGGVLGCVAGGAGWVTYTGLECTGDEGDTGAGDGNEGEGDGEGEGEGEGDGTGDGEGDGSGSGDGTGDGDGDGDGDGEGEGGNCVYVNGVEICKEGTGQDCVYINGAKVCQDGEGTEWGGDCKSGFTCEGDALICAISKAEHDRNCELFDNNVETDEYKLYESERGNAASDSEFGALTGALPGTEINVGDYLKTDNLLGSGSCMADKTFVWNGRTFTIPLSDLCDLFKWLGLILQSVALLWGMRIAFGGGV